MAATALAPSEFDSIVCSEASCAGAYSHRDECRCSCGGDGHGVDYRAQAARGAAVMRDRIARVGGVFNLLPQIEDDAW